MRRRRRPCGPFRHSVIVRPTSFAPKSADAQDKRVQFQSLYKELVGDEARNRGICEDVLEAVRRGPIAVDPD